MISGKIHSIETMGLVDGPGIRTVFFLQGCPLRCSYCHNPDSQGMFSKQLITVEELVKMTKRYKPYYHTSGGGVTFSGGEPLLQGEFLVSALKALKEEDICTTLDTSGFGDEKYYKEILENIDLVLLDIKHFDDVGYKNITGSNMKKLLTFLSHLKDYDGKIWIRHVMVPGVTDNEDSIYKLINTVSNLTNKIDRIEILPYHIMGVQKYEELGIDYKLRDVPAMDKELARKYEKLANDLLEDEKIKLRRYII